MRKLFVPESFLSVPVLVIATLFCAVARPLPAQIVAPASQAGIPDASGHRSGDEPDFAQKEMLARQQVRRNEARQQEIVKDTTKLLALATELKSEVDKTNKDVLSIDVIKKADEIEKLSKSIRDRMKN